MTIVKTEICVKKKRFWLKYWVIYGNMGNPRTLELKERAKMFMDTYNRLRMQLSKDSRFQRVGECIIRRILIVMLNTQGLLSSKNGWICKPAWSEPEGGSSTPSMHQRRKESRHQTWTWTTWREQMRDERNNQTVSHGLNPELW